MRSAAAHTISSAPRAFFLHGIRHALTTGHQAPAPRPALSCSPAPPDKITSIDPAHELPTLRARTYTLISPRSKLVATVTDEIAAIKAQDQSFAPALTIVQVGDRQDSNVYIRMKIKRGQEAGIAVTHLKLPRSTTEDQVGAPPVPLSP